MEVIGVVISHVGGLAFSGPNEFIDFFTEQMQYTFGATVFGENGAIYLGMGLTNVTDEVAYDEIIFNGANLVTGFKLGPNGYGGEMQDILILPVMPNRKGES